MKALHIGTGWKVDYPLQVRGRRRNGRERSTKKTTDDWGGLGESVSESDPALGGVGGRALRRVKLRPDKVRRPKMSEEEKTEALSAQLRNY